MNATSKITPYELWHGKAPDVNYFHVFGCLTYIHVPKEKRWKLDSWAVKGVHLGYDGAGYHIWNLTAKWIVIIWDVTHNETVQGWTEQLTTRIELLENGNLETSEPGIVPVEVSEVVDKLPEASEQLDNDETIVLKNHPHSGNSRTVLQTPAPRVGAIDRLFCTPVQPSSTIQTIWIHTPQPVQTPTPRSEITWFGYQVRP